MTHNGTSIVDWKHYEKKARAMNIDQLRYTLEDCKRAADVAPDHANFPCKASGFYQDEIHVYSRELRKRLGK
jgi:hypothetical protein